MDALNGAVVPDLMHRRFRTIGPFLAVIEPPQLTGCHVNLLVACFKDDARRALQDDMVTVPVVGVGRRIRMLEDAATGLDTVDDDAAQASTTHPCHQLHDKSTGLRQSPVNLLIDAFVLVIPRRIEMLLRVLLHLKDRARREPEDQAVNLTKRTLRIGPQVSIFRPPLGISGDLGKQRHHVDALRKAQKVFHRGKKFMVGAAV